MTVQRLPKNFETSLIDVIRPSKFSINFLILSFLSFDNFKVISLVFLTNSKKVKFYEGTNHDFIVCNVKGLKGI